MNNNSFDLKEIQEAAIKFAKDHPFGALLAVAAITGISKGVAEGISKLGPTVEKCWKYTVDKAAEYLPKPAAQAILTDDNIIDVNADCHQAEAVAA